MIEIGDAVEKIKADHEVGVDMSTGEVHNLTTGEVYQGTALPPFVQAIAKPALVNFAKQRSEA